MKEAIWYVPFGSKDLLKPFEMKEDQLKPGSDIREGASFCVKLGAIRLSQRLEGFLRNKNSFMILSEASLDEDPRVRRIHYFEESVPFDKVAEKYLADTVFWSKNYSGKRRLDLNIFMLEVDTDAGERRETRKAASNMASFAGAAYPLLLPYLQVPPAVNVSIDKIMKSLETGSHVVRFPLSLYDNPETQKGVPLREGSYVLFANPADGNEYTVDSEGVLQKKDRSQVEDSYVILKIRKTSDFSDRRLILQDCAALLTRLQNRKSCCSFSALDYLEDIMMRARAGE